MGDSSDEHDPVGVDDRVHDSIRADPDPEVVAAGQLRRATRTRFGRERVDCLADPLSHRPLEAAVRARSLRVKANLVHVAG